MILSRYLDPDVLNLVADLRFEPLGLVIGNLAGAHKSPSAGFAVEFTGHREYVPGDDPKHIDWRVYFNRDKYFVKQYELETNLVCHLLLDVSASMRYGEGHQQKLLYAAQLAAILGYSVIRQSDKVSLATFDHRLCGFLPPSNSLGQIVRISEHLDEAAAVDKSEIAECLNDFAGRIGRREIVIVLSDFFCDLGPLESALQRLRYSQHEIVLFHVLHHDELEFEWDGLTKFEGLEIPDTLWAQPEDLRHSYLTALRRFCGQLQKIAERNHCEHLLVSTRQSLADLLSDYLHQRRA